MQKDLLKSSVAIDAIKPNSVGIVPVRSHETADMMVSDKTKVKRNFYFRVCTRRVQGTYLVRVFGVMSIAQAQMGVAAKTCCQSRLRWSEKGILLVTKITWISKLAAEATHAVKALLGRPTDQFPTGVTLKTGYLLWNGSGTGESGRRFHVSSSLLFRNLPSFSDVREVNLPTSEGNIPDNPLFCRSMLCNARIFPNSEGMGPCMYSLLTKIAISTQSASSIHHTSLTRVCTILTNDQGIEIA